VSSATAGAPVLPDQPAGDPLLLVRVPGRAMRRLVPDQHPDRL